MDKSHFRFFRSNYPAQLYGEEPGAHTVRLFSWICRKSYPYRLDQVSRMLPVLSATCDIRQEVSDWPDWPTPCCPLTIYTHAPDENAAPHHIDYPAWGVQDDMLSTFGMISKSGDALTRIEICAEAGDWLSALQLILIQHGRQFPGRTVCMEFIRWIQSRGLTGVTKPSDLRRVCVEFSNCVSDDREHDFWVAFRMTQIMVYLGFPPATPIISYSADFEADGLLAVFLGRLDLYSSDHAQSSILERVNQCIVLFLLQWTP